MKYLVTSHKDAKEKAEIQEKGLYCYDLRGCDDGVGIATIEEFVFINRVGSIITNEEIKFQKDDFIDYEFFEKVNENVGTIEELLSFKTQNKTRQLDDNMYVIDVGYRNKEPIALVEKTDITKAKNDFKKVLAGGNLADTFNKKKNKNKDVR